MVGKNKSVRVAVCDSGVCVCVCVCGGGRWQCTIIMQDNVLLHACTTRATNTACGQGEGQREAVNSVNSARCWQSTTDSMGLYAPAIAEADLRAAKAQECRCQACLVAAVGVKVELILSTIVGQTLVANAVGSRQKTPSGLRTDHDESCEKCVCVCVWGGGGGQY
jgi:hypothetical protein